jgi:hypothetical protein
MVRGYTISDGFTQLFEKILLVMKPSHLFVLLLFWVAATLPGAAQERPPANKAEFEKNYARRIKLSNIAGVYIPKDLEDAFANLNRLIDKNGREKFKNMGEVDAARRLHFSFGRWITTNWGFYEGSRLSHYIRENFQIYHPEDMAQFIIILYHRYLNKSPLNVKELVEHYHIKQEKQKEERINKGQILSQEVIKREKG